MHNIQILPKTPIILVYKDKILITGSSGYIGFIGSILTTEIKKNIFSIDKQKPKFKDFKIKQINLLEKKKLKKFIFSSTVSVYKNSTQILYEKSQTNQDKKFNIINLGSSDGYSILQLIKTLEIILRKNIKYTFIKKRFGDKSKLVCSIKKAKEILLW